MRAVRPNLPDPASETRRQRKARIWRSRPYHKFELATSQRFPVGPEEDQQEAARLLVKKKGWVAYRGMNGLLCDVGIPKSERQAKRIFKWRPGCDSCGVHFATTYSPPHTALFCASCLERENPELSASLSPDNARKPLK